MKTTPTSTLLKKYRAKQRFTTKAAALSCGIATQQYSNLERGYVNLGPRLAKKLVTGLNIPKAKMVELLLREYKTRILENLV